MYHIYTDGACSGNRRGGNCIGGFGYVIVRVDKEVDPEIIITGGDSCNDATNNRMEMSGVIAGLKALKKLDKDAECIVFTDSTYVCNNCNDYLDDCQKVASVISNEGFYVNCLGEFLIDGEFGEFD